MADLLGISHFPAHSPQDLSGLSKMGDEVLAVLGGAIETATAGTSAISIVKHHPLDPVSIAREGPTGAVVAWMGPAPPTLSGEDRVDALGLARALNNRDDAYLSALPPPFSAAVRTTSPEALWLVSDRYGLYPLYYFCECNLLAFASKLAPLLHCDLIRWSLDQRAILDFFTYEHVTGDRTFANCVHVLPPATALCFADGKLSQHSYSHLSFRPRKLSADDLAGSLYTELSNSVAESVRHRSRVAVTLSGGLDSRAILGCALERAGDVRTYTFGPHDCRDVQVARELARRTGVPNTTVEIDGRYLLEWLDHGIFVTGGMVSCTQFHIIALATLLAEEADVVLDGLGGDALTGGHLKPMAVAARTTETALASLYRQRATAWASSEERNQIFDPDFVAGLDCDPREAMEGHFRCLGGEPRWWGCHRFDLLERQRRFTQFGPHQLRPLLDVRTPFYSNRLVDLMLSASPRHLLGQRAYLKMHARHLSLLAAVPDSARGLPLSYPLSVRLGKQALDFVKRSTPASLRGAVSGTPESPTDYRGWFRGALREFLEDRLLGENEAMQGILRRKEVERIVGEHVRGVSDHSAKLGCLLTFDAWLRSLKTHHPSSAAVSSSAEPPWC